MFKSLLLNPTFHWFPAIKCLTSQYVLTHMKKKRETCFYGDYKKEHSMVIFFSESYFMGNNNNEFPQKCHFLSEVHDYFFAFVTNR